MEEAVVGSVIGATVQVVLQNLLSIPIEEFNVFRDFKKDLKKLKDSFLMIQDFLSDAEMQQVTNKAVNRWLKKLESVAFDADNVFDELNYYVLHSKVETKNNMKKKGCFLARLEVFDYHIPNVFDDGPQIPTHSCSKHCLRRVETSIAMGKSSEFTESRRDVKEIN